MIQIHEKQNNSLQPSMWGSIALNRQYMRRTLILKSTQPKEI